MNYKMVENMSRAVNNMGDPVGFGLYVSTAKGKRRKYVADYPTIKDLDNAIQNYMNDGFEYISSNIIVRYTTGQSLIERRYTEER